MSEHTVVERDEIAVQFVSVEERIGPTFQELLRTAVHDPSRPSLEHYRRLDEIDLLLPVLDRSS